MGLIEWFKGLPLWVRVNASFRPSGAQAAPIFKPFLAEILLTLPVEMSVIKSM